MNFLRLVSPGLRAGLLVAVGSVLLAVPFALGLSVAAIVAGVALLWPSAPAARPARPSSSSWSDSSSRL